MSTTAVGPPTTTVVNGVTYYNGNPTGNANGYATPGSNTLNNNDFLNLLVKQLQYQDPTNPISNEDFASQLAQFGSLQQMQNLNTSFGQMTSVNQLSTAAGLIGHTVTTNATDSTGAAIGGQVTSATIDSSGNINVTVGGTSVLFSKITGVTA